MSKGLSLFLGLLSWSLSSYSKKAMTKPLTPPSQYVGLYKGYAISKDEDMENMKHE